jgi:hypothetical protein
VPAVGPGAFPALHGQDVLVAVQRRYGRVRGGQRAEQGREPDLAGVVEVLAAEDQDLVRQQRRGELRDGGLVEWGAQVDAVDLGAEPAADPAYVQAGVNGGHGCPFPRWCARRRGT